MQRYKTEPKEHERICWLNPIHSRCVKMAWSLNSFMKGLTVTCVVTSSNPVPIFRQYLSWFLFFNLHHTDALPRVSNLLCTMPTFLLDSRTYAQINKSEINLYIIQYGSFVPWWPPNYFPQDCRRWYSTPSLSHPASVGGSVSNTVFDSPPSPAHNTPTHNFNLGNHIYSFFLICYFYPSNTVKPFKAQVLVHLFSSHVFVVSLNLLEPEVFFLILAHPVNKMWIIQEPNTLELWNKLHFEEEKTDSIYRV